MPPIRFELPRRPTLAALLLTLMGCASATPSKNAPPREGEDRTAIEGRADTVSDGTAGTPLRYRRGAVASDSHPASLAGVEILQAGGNAVDAAVATALTLSVTRPYSCGLGGGGFMLVFDPATDERVALDFRETCPSGVDPRFYVDQPETASGYDPSLYGGRAVGVPGEIPGLVAAHDRWGVLPWSDLVAPAVRAAREGFLVDRDYLRAVDRVAEIRRRHPDLRSLSAWVWENLCGNGTLAEGDRLRQPALAAFLERLGREGIAAWNGPGGVSPKVAGADRAADGCLTAADIGNYRVAWRRPLEVDDAIDGLDAILMPPPSSGGIAIAQVLSMIERRHEAFGAPAPGTSAHAELLVGSLRHAFADRARHLADPDHVDVPVRALLDPDSIARAADRLEPGTIVPVETCGTLPGPSSGSPPDDRGTSHFSVIDESGMTVACTQTINGLFGSLVAVPAIGVVLNNEMNDFTTVPGEANLFGLSQSDRNLPSPGKRPLSSMSPTILVRDGRTVLTAGASGGPRIITGTLQVVLEIVQGDLGAAEAVSRPRLHHQWRPDVVRLEAAATTQASALEAIGHETAETGAVGVVQAIVVHEDGYEPASDPRKGGRAAGW